MLSELSLALSDACAGSAGCPREPVRGPDALPSCWAFPLASWGEVAGDGTLGAGPGPREGAAWACKYCSET